MSLSWLLVFFACFFILLPGANSIEVGFSAENGGESVGITSDYDVDTDVIVSEESLAYFDQVGIENTRSVSGTGNINVVQSYSGSCGYTGQAATLAKDATGSLTGSATLKSNSLNANQRISASGSLIAVGSWAADGESKSEAKTILTSAGGIQGSFDGIASLYAGYSTDALISSHIKGALESIVSATGSTTSTRNSNGVPWDADQFLHAQTPGTPGVIDRLTFRISPLFRIQPAIDFAKAGDTINVPAGYYPEDVNIYKWIGLVGFGNPTARSFSLTNGAQLMPGSGGISAPLVTVNQGSKIQDGITLASNDGIVNVNSGTYGDNLDQSFYANNIRLVGNGDPVTNSISLDQLVDGKISSITANTVNVLNNNAKIQEGVTLAPSGGTVNVAAGTYTENVQIDKSLTLNGAGAGNTIVDGNQAGSVFTVGINNPNVDVILSGMTATNGKSNNGGGIWSRGTLALNSVSLTDNTAIYGGGIYNKDGLSVTDSTISGNTANYGGGVYNLGTLNVVNCAISNNNAAQEGGGIYNYGAITVNGGSISGNRAGVGGGLFNWQGRIAVDNTNIANNFAGYGGGGVFNYDILELRNSLVTENTATWGGGVSNVGEATIEGSSISKNTAMQNGGGINNEGTVTVTSNTMSDNNAENGGGIYNDQGTVNLYGGSITGNTANFGAGIASQGNVILNEPLGTMDASYSSIVTVNKGAKIQEGIDLAAQSGTVNVAAGTFNENLIINKHLALLGAGSGDDTSFNTLINAVDKSKSVISIVTGGTSEDNRLIVKDLQVTGAASSSGISINGVGDISHITLDNVKSSGNYYGADFSSLGSGNSISDVIISNSQVTNSGMYGVNIDAQNHGSIGNVDITDSTISDSGRDGVNIDAQNHGSIGNIDLTDSTISDSGWSGVSVYAGLVYNTNSMVSGTIDKVDIKGCTISNSGSDGVDVRAYSGSTISSIGITESTISGAGGGGVYGGAYYGGTTIGNIEIAGSTISGCDRGLSMGATGGGINSNIALTDSTISDSFYDGIWAAASYGGKTGIVITRSTITGSGWNGVSTKAWGGGSMSKLEAHESNIYGNSEFGIMNQAGTTFDATDNWWGNGGAGVNAGRPGEEGNNPAGSVLYTSSEAWRRSYGQTTSQTLGVVTYTPWSTSKFPEAP